MSKYDCKKVKEMLNDVLDGELSSSELSAFNQHLEKCSKCSDCFDSEKVLLDSIKEKIDSKCCPEDVLNKIKAKILDK